MPRRRKPIESTGGSEGTGGGDDDRSVIDVIADIRSGAISVRSITIEARQACVEHLLCEGLSPPEIASALHMNYRMALRDAEAIKRKNAPNSDPETVAQVCGELWTHARGAQMRLMRIARDKGQPPGVRIEAERAWIEITDKVVARLQSLGAMPSTTHRLEASVAHHFADVPTIDELQVQIAALLVSAPGSAAADLQQLGTLADQARLLEPGTPGDPNPQPEGEPDNGRR